MAVLGSRNSERKVGPSGCSSRLARISPVSSAMRVTIGSSAATSARTIWRRASASSSSARPQAAPRSRATQLAGGPAARSSGGGPETGSCAVRPGRWRRRAMGSACRKASAIGLSMSANTSSGAGPERSQAGRAAGWPARRDARRDPRGRASGRAAPWFDRCRGPGRESGAGRCAPARRARRHRSCRSWRPLLVNRGRAAATWLGCTAMTCSPASSSRSISSPSGRSSATSVDARARSVAGREPAQPCLVVDGTRRPSTIRPSASTTQTACSSLAQSMPGEHWTHHPPVGLLTCCRRRGTVAGAH